MVCTHSNAVVSFSKRQLQFNFWAVCFLVAVLFTLSLVAANCGLYAARRLGEGVRASRVMRILSHLKKQIMSHQKNLQIKLHETRGKIVKLELELEDLRNSRQASAAKITEISNKIKQLQSSM